MYNVRPTQGVQTRVFSMKTVSNTVPPISSASLIHAISLTKPTKMSLKRLSESKAESIVHYVRQNKMWEPIIRYKIHNVNTPPYVKY